MNRAEVEALIGKLSKMTKDELFSHAIDPSTSMLEITVANILVKASEDGDYSRLNFLLDRSIGRVKDSLEVSVAKPTITIERANGEKIALGAAKHALTAKDDSAGDE